MGFITARRRAPLLATAAALALAACGGPSRPAPPAVHTVVVDQLAYSPKAVTANTGDVIAWVNKDFLRHSATAANGAFDVDLPPGATAKTVLRKTGAIKYFCRYHPGMTGTVSVAEKG